MKYLIKKFIYTGGYVGIGRDFRPSSQNTSYYGAFQVQNGDLFWCFDRGEYNSVAYYVKNPRRINFSIEQKKIKWIDFGEKLFFLHDDRAVWKFC